MPHPRRAGEASSVVALTIVKAKTIVKANKLRNYWSGDQLSTGGWDVMLRSCSQQRITRGCGLVVKWGCACRGGAGNRAWARAALRDATANPRRRDRGASGRRSSCSRRTSRHTAGSPSWRRSRPWQPSWSSSFVQPATMLSRVDDQRARTRRHPAMLSARSRFRRHTDRARRAVHAPARPRDESALRFSPPAELRGHPMTPRDRARAGTAPQPHTRRRQLRARSLFPPLCGRMSSPSQRCTPSREASSPMRAVEPLRGDRCKQSGVAISSTVAARRQLGIVQHGR